MQKLEAPLPQQPITKDLSPAVFCCKWGTLWLAAYVTFLSSGHLAVYLQHIAEVVLLFQMVIILVFCCCERNYYTFSGLKQCKFMISVSVGQKGRHSVAGSYAQGLTRPESRCWLEQWSQVKWGVLFWSHMIVGKIYFLVSSSPAGECLCDTLPSFKGLSN